MLNMLTKLYQTVPFLAVEYTPQYSTLSGAREYAGSSPGYRSLSQNPTSSNRTISTPTNSVTPQYFTYHPGQTSALARSPSRGCPHPPPPPPPSGHHRHGYQSSPTDAVRTSPAKMLSTMKSDPYASTMLYHTMQVNARGPTTRGRQLRHVKFYA